MAEPLQFNFGTTSSGYAPAEKRDRAKSLFTYSPVNLTAPLKPILETSTPADPTLVPSELLTNDHSKDLPNPETDPTKINSEKQRQQSLAKQYGLQTASNIAGSIANGFKAVGEQSSRQLNEVNSWKQASAQNSLERLRQQSSLNLQISTPSSYSVIKGMLGTKLTTFLNF